MTWDCLTLSLSNELKKLHANASTNCNLEVNTQIFCLFQIKAKIKEARHEQSRTSLRNVWETLIIGFVDAWETSSCSDWSLLEKKQKGMTLGLLKEDTKKCE